MTELPRHPDASDAGASQRRRGPASRSWWSYGLVIAVAALLVLMVVLHFAGVLGPGSH